MEEVVVRPYRKEDRSFVREMSWNTAFRGEPADIFFEGKGAFCDFLTSCFTDYEPGSCFVAEADGRLVGYLIGAKNANFLARTFHLRILPRLLIQAIREGTLLRKKNIIFIAHCLMSFLRGEFFMPNFSQGYPATLHINIAKNFRNLKIGSRLITVYLDYLNKEKIPGVCLATMSDKAGGFFERQGFNLLYRGRRSYFCYLIKNDVPIYIYGKKLA